MEKDNIKDIILKALLEEDNYEIRPMFQPIYELSKNKLIGYEALCRIVKKNQDGTVEQIIYPNEFILFAERSLLIVEIDFLTIRKACQKLKEHGKDLFLFVNMSPKTILMILNSDYLKAKFLELINNCGLNHKLFIEITERIEMTRIDKEFESKLNQNGVFFVIDDFGAGHSTYKYLVMLNAPIVKIDGEFVKEIVNNDICKGIVYGIAKMCKNLGKHVLAEFVENENIAKELRKLGVKYAQGYYYGKPSFDI